jgi:hypothetical protein
MKSLNSQHRRVGYLATYKLQLSSSLYSVYLFIYKTVKRTTIKTSRATLHAPNTGPFEPLNVQNDRLVKWLTLDASRCHHVTEDREFRLLC